MNGYQGFYLRDYLGEQPGQSGGPWTACPDIVVYGPSLPANPGQAITPAGYATDYGSNLIIGQANFIYIRALDAGGAVLTGRAWLFYTSSDLALWPQNWLGSSITVAGEPLNYQPLVAEAGGSLCMTSLPFVLTPPPPQPGQHWNLIAIIENEPSNPPQSPTGSIGVFPNFGALAEFVMETPYVGWRDTVGINAPPTWSQTTSITGPAPAELFSIGIQCTNMPTDGRFAYTVPGPAPAIPPIVVPPQPITNPNLIYLTQVDDWPAGASSSITVSYWMGATPPPPGASITVVMYVAGQMIRSLNHSF